jgi:hypothetical protein
LGKAHFSDAQVARWRAAHSAKAGERSPTERLTLAWQRVAGDWQSGFALWPLGVAAVVMMRDRRAATLAAVLAVQAIVWLGFTHLQGRFLVVAIPVCAIAVGAVAHRAWPFVAVTGIGLMAAVGFCVLLAHPQRFPLVRAMGAKAALGGEDLRPLIAIDWNQLPADRPLALVGDAQVFYYTDVPMSCLTYRTVFDVPGAKEAPDWLNAWTGAPPHAGTAVVVFPGELLRFEDTYESVPGPPKDQLLGRPPYVIDR